MLEQNDIKTIESTIEEFFQKMTITLLSVEVKTTTTEKPSGFRLGIFNRPIKEDQNSNKEKISDSVDLNIRLEEPQILIGEKGQTLFETQRLLRSMLIRKIQKVFYLNLDINEYKKNKIEYLKKTAKEVADSVSLTKEEKALFPMSAYERRIIHAELSQRTDITTGSEGEGVDRHIVIKPR